MGRGNDEKKEDEGSRKKLAAEVETEWRELEKYCWADFTRFVDGWGGWGNETYMNNITENLLKENLQNP